MSLSAKFLGAVKSNYTGMIIRVAAQLVAQIAIMRMLGPELVGTFGYALLLNGVLALVIDQGFGWSLIQGDFSQAEVSIAFSRLLLAGGLGAAVVYAISYPIASWLQSPLAGDVIRWSAPAYLMIGLYAISHARLRRDLRFRELQYATNGAYVIAYPGIGLAMAWAGCGVWSLLGAWYAQALLQILIGHFYAPHSLRLTSPWRPCKAGALGRQVAAINVLNWAVDNSSATVVGTMGPQALGSYNAASVLARQPALQLVQTLQGLLFSTASAINDDSAKVRKLYLASLAVVATLVAPLYGFFFAHADTLVTIVFGQKWLGASGVLAGLSLGMTAMALSTVTSSIHTAKGGQGAEVRAQALCLLVMLAGLVWAASRSAEAVAWAVSAAYVLRLCWQLASVVRNRLILWRDIQVTLQGPMLLGVLAALPLSRLLRPSLGQWLAELVSLLLLLLFAMLLIRLRPMVFVSPMLVELLGRVSVGRRLLRALGMSTPLSEGA